MVQSIGDQTVPDALLGCWRRNWIRFGDDGANETDVAVIWLQTASGMGDVRIDPNQQATETDSSCGITVVDETTAPYFTADWRDGQSGFSQQPVPSFPEAGWLDWRSDSIVYEMAPSGAYVEEWERLPGSTGLVEHAVAVGETTRVNLYTAGDHVLLARERTASEPIHEFSYGRRTSSDAKVIIELSTIAAAVGSVMDLDLDWQIVSRRAKAPTEGDSAGAR